MQLDKALINLLIISIPFYIFRFNIGPIPTTLLETLLYAIFLILLFRKKINIKNNFKSIVPALILLLAGLIAVAADPDFVSGLGLWKAYFFDGFLVFLIILSSKDKEDFSQIIFYNGILVSALTLLLYFAGVRTDDGRILDLDRLSPNYLAMYLVPTLVIGLRECYKKLNIANVIGSVLIVVALYLTFSRGAIIGLVGSAIFGLYFYLRRRKWGMAKPALIVMLAIFLLAGYLVFRPDWSDHARKATSSNIRYYIWSTSIEIIKQKPIFGVGLSNYQNYFSNLTADRVNYPEFISPVALTAHNIYLHFFVSGGAIGFLAFIYLLWSSRFWKKDNVASIALISILTYGLVDTPFFRNDLATIFWVLLAMLHNKSKS